MKKSCYNYAPKYAMVDIYFLTAKNDIVKTDIPIT